MPVNTLGYEVVRSATFYAPRVETVKPNLITVLQQENSHDMVSFVVYLADNDSQRYNTGVPVQVQWGLLNRRVEVFQGYVHHTEPITTVAGDDRARRAMVKVVCIGATYPMKNKNRRVWVNRTIPSVLQEVFNNYKLSLHVGRHDRVWDTLVQAGETDWAFICSLADRLGWVILPNNTDVTVRPRYSNLRSALATATRFSAPAPTDSPQGLGAILYFRGVDGETTLDGGQKANRLSYGLDPYQGTPFVAAVESAQPQLGWLSPTPFFKDYAENTSASYGEALHRLGGGAEAARFYIQATVEAIGDATVRPGRLVYLSGLGAKNNGLWYVQGAEHECNMGTYYLHLTLGRDARWDNGLRPSGKRRRVVQNRVDAYGDPVAVVPPTVLVSGTWRAAYNVPVPS